jgi:uncharacterized membrane protein
MGHVSIRDIHAETNLFSDKQLWTSGGKLKKHARSQPARSMMIFTAVLEEVLISLRNLLMHLLLACKARIYRKSRHLTRISQPGTQAKIYSRQIC